MASSTLDILDYNHELDADGDDDYARVTDDVGAAQETEQALRRRPTSSRGELFVVRGETTGTSRSSRIPTKKRRPLSATSTSSNQHSHSRGDLERTRHEEQINGLRSELAALRMELEHAHEERDEMQKAFHRLDQEIVNGYNLTERKEKELKIAELTAKNQKLSQMLEKELNTQAALRAVNGDLQRQLQQVQDQLTLVNQVLAPVEAKNVALTESNNQLVVKYAAAQQRLEEAQLELTDLQAKSIESTTGRTQQSTAYEEKLNLWERKFTDCQRRCDDMSQQLRAEQDHVHKLERSLEASTQEKMNLEQELAALQDRLILMNGTMKTMEARVEAGSANPSLQSSTDRMSQRIRLLEEELLSKNRLVESLRETLDTILTGGNQTTAGVHGSQSRSRSTPASSNRRCSTTVANRLLQLSQRLRKAEEARDHKSRCLHVLMGCLPQLLQQLDGLQDRIFSAEESNAILKDAVHQLQSPESDLTSRDEAAMAIAREKYLLSGPYQSDLLMGFTLHRAFSEYGMEPKRKNPKAFPFQVRTITRKSYGQDAKSGQEKSELTIVSEADDSNGAVFLNRSKINAFLQLLQGRAVQGKAKHLLVQKIADLLTSHRDLMATYSSETALFKSSLAVLTQECQQLKSKLERSQNALEKRDLAVAGDTSQRGHHKLLLKLMDWIRGSPSIHSSTFVTQSDPFASLIDRVPSSSSTGGQDAGIHLDLEDCCLADDDLEPLLLKLSVSRLDIRALILDGNAISDQGVATIAAFLETSSATSLRLVSLKRCDEITADGLAHLQSALARNPSVHHVESDAKTHCLVAVSTHMDFDTLGRPQNSLRVVLPGSAFVESAASFPGQDESVQRMIDHLESRGFQASASIMVRAQSVYQRREGNRPQSRGARVSRAATIAPSLSSRRTSRQGQQEKKLQALEAALRRADSTATAAAESGQRGITLTQMQHLLKHASSASGGNAVKNQRLHKLQFAQSHLATIRGLGKRQIP